MSTAKIEHTEVGRAVHEFFVAFPTERHRVAQALRAYGSPLGKIDEIESANIPGFLRRLGELGDELGGAPREMPILADLLGRLRASEGMPTHFGTIDGVPVPAPKVSCLERDSTPLNTQVGGAHYKDLKIQPVEYIHANGIGYFEGNVIKYVTRWRSKGGIADLEKAKHYIDLLIELENKNA